MMNIYAWLHLTLNLTLTYTQQNLTFGIKFDLKFLQYFSFPQFLLVRLQSAKFCHFSANLATRMKLSGIIIWLLRNTKMPGGKNFGPSNRENLASLWEKFPVVKKSNFLDSLQTSHNFRGNFNQNNINEKNFNQKLMFFDFIFILTLLLECRVTGLSGSEREKFL